MPLYVAAAAGTGTNNAAPAVTGRLYRTQASGGGNATASTIARLHARPFWLQAGTLDRLYVHHVANATASELVRLGIYADSSNRPGSLLLDAGTIDLSTATGVKSITISQAVSTARYWIVAVRQGPTNTATLRTYTFNSTSFVLENAPGWTEIRPDDPPTSLSDRSASSVYVNSVTGALNASFGTPLWNDSEECPMVVVRYA
jgi:hypothetical protein